jgi:hypothetical protein
MVAQFESPLGGENGLGQPSLEAYAPEARTLFQDCREVSVRVLNSNRRDQKFKNESRIVHCEPVTMVAPPNVEQPQVQDSALKFQDMIARARPNVSDDESRGFEEFLTGYGDIFAMKSDDYGRTRERPDRSANPRGDYP